jgi:hypothetical protein
MPRGDDAVYAGFYAPHLSGTRRDIMFRRAPSREREGLIERMYMRVLTEMCVNRFKWTNLPQSVDVRFMELTLFRFALSVFYWDNNFDKYLALQGAPSGRMDYAQNPLAFTINGNSRFISKTLPATKVVPIWANYLRIPDYDIVTIYAQKLAELDRTIEINSKNARRPKVLVANENSRLSAVNLARQFDEGNPLLQVNSDGGLAKLDEVITSFDLGIEPDSLEKLHILRTRLWGECMGLLGIDFANQDKKERLVAAEVDANGDQVENMRRVNLNAREMACEMINRMYPDLNVGVEYWVSNVGMQTQTDILADQNGGDMS